MWAKIITSKLFMYFISHKQIILSPFLQQRSHLFLLTYLWISPSITPRLTRRVSWCSREPSGGVGLCCSPGWRLVFWVGGESVPWWTCNVSCLAVSFKAFASWLLVDVPVFLCGSNFFRRLDNWGLRRRTRVPLTHRILKKKPAKTKMNLTHFFF